MSYECHLMNEYKTNKYHISLSNAIVHIKTKYFMFLITKIIAYVYNTYVVVIINYN